MDYFDRLDCRNIQLIYTVVTETSTYQVITIIIASAKSNLHAIDMLNCIVTGFKLN